MLETIRDSDEDRGGWDVGSGWCGDGKRDEDRVGDKDGNWDGLGRGNRDEDRVGVGMGIEMRIRLVWGWG